MEAMSAALMRVRMEVSVVVLGNSSVANRTVVR
jgi:hypothetical protein